MFVDDFYKMLHIKVNTHSMPCKLESLSLKYKCVTTHFLTRNLPYQLSIFILAILIAGPLRTMS